MADKWAIINGSWSSTSTWNSGTLPTSSDDVYADGKLVTIDQNVQVLSLRTTLRSGGIVGGTFSVTTSGLYITASQILSGTTQCIRSVLSSNQSVNISGFIHNGTFSSSVITLSGGIANILGTVSCGSGASSIGLNVSNALVNMTGNIIGGSGSSAFGCQLVTSSTLNLIGNINGGPGSNGWGVYAQSGSIINATGSVTAGSLGVSSFGIYSNANSAPINVWGNVFGGGATTCYGIYLNLAGSLNLVGDVYGGSAEQALGLYMNTGTNLSMTGSIYGGVGSNCAGLYINSIGSHTITGNIVGGTGGGVSIAAPGIYQNSVSTITINGTVSAKGANVGFRSVRGGTITINGKVFASSANYGFYPNGGAIVTINGDQIASPSQYAVYSAGPLTLNGNIIGTNSVSGSNYLQQVTTAPLIINGNITQLGSAGTLVQTRSLSAIITGNLTSGTVSSSFPLTTVFSSGASTLTINGNLVTNNTAALSLTGTSQTTVTVNGNVIAGTASPAILSPEIFYKTIVNGNIVNTGNMMAFYGWKINVGNTSSNSMTLQSINNTNRSISTSNALAGLPSTQDVRTGVTYGVAGTLTGTLAVPTYSRVSLDVAVDDGFGTGILNSNDLGAILGGFTY